MSGGLGKDRKLIKAGGRLVGTWEYSGDDIEAFYEEGSEF